MIILLGLPCLICIEEFGIEEIINVHIITILCSANLPETSFRKLCCSQMSVVNLSLCKLFSSPELKDQVSFSNRL